MGICPSDGWEPAGARDSQELTLVRALNQIAGSHQVAVGDQLLDLEVQVRERGQISGDELSLRLRSDDVGKVGVVADELGRQQLLRGVKVLGIPRLHPAADDGLRLACKHARVPLRQRSDHAADIPSRSGTKASMR
jgi:hypothetical protein